VGRRLVDPQRETAAFLDGAVIERLIADEVQGERSRTQLLLAITMLELWLSSLVAAERESVAA
jgi:hypothetical protein